jgi:hypothetical protein
VKLLLAFAISQALFCTLPGDPRPPSRDELLDSSARITGVVSCSKAHSGSRKPSNDPLVTGHQQVKAWHSRGAVALPATEKI